MKACSFSHLLTLLGWTMSLPLAKAAAPEPPSEVQHVVVAHRLLETEAASAWGIPGTLFSRRLRWTDGSESKTPVIWVSAAQHLEMTFFEDFNRDPLPILPLALTRPTDEEEHSPPEQGLLIRFRLVGADKSPDLPMEPREMALFGQAIFQCDPGELRGRLQLGEWAESWSWGRDETAMGPLKIDSSASSTNAKPLATAALRVCATMEAIQSNMREVGSSAEKTKETVGK